ncbi:MAG TPA: aldo/keto reductase [Gemmatimonadaceae bacterium]|nr:aldo/keto reductase [Gemmatimonadaceae bacterium]
MPQPRTKSRSRPRARPEASFRPDQPGGIPRRPLGSTGAYVSALGLGGYHLGSIANEREAIGVVHAAIDGGITFMDNAWDYHDGRSETLMGKALANGYRDRVFLMTKVCTHGRDARVAMRMLEESLRRLRTDHLDLWQVHEVAYENDPENHFAPGGVIEALDRAKEQGKVRFVGFTGHKDPSLHLRMLAQGYPFDTVQMPLNPFDAQFRSFEQRILPELERRGIAAIGMKSMGGDGIAVKKRVITAGESLRYAMSLPVATTVSGIDSMKVLRQNLRIARGFERLQPEEMRTIREKVAEKARDGRFELYKTTARHEGAEGRRQHGFPDEEELEG